jgi:hypothetical protein
MPKIVRIAVLTAALACLAALLLSCSVSNPTGPDGQGTRPPDQAAGLLDLLASATPTATTEPTATSTPTATPTPLPTPTPIAALSVGSLPAGQVLFSTQRAGEAGEQLWQVSAGQGLVELLSAVLPGGWRCAAGAEATCALVTLDRGLFVLQPTTGTMTLLDDLTPVQVQAGGAVSPTVLLTGTALLSLTVAVSGTTPLSPTLAVSATAPVSATLDVTRTLPVSLTAGITSTIPLTASQPTVHPVLAFSPRGQRLAVATADRVTVYDLAAPALLAILQAGGPAELAWSPDGQRLALAYPAGAGNALALWNLADGRLDVLAQMEAAGHLAWAPDGSKLAFDARTNPGAPASQGGQSDVYVLYLRSGEIANLTELFLRNNGVPAAGQIAAWAPQWEPDSATLRYTRGVPDVIEEQNVVRHALRSRSPAVLWPAADVGKLGIVAEPGGAWEARVTVRDGRDALQTRQAGGAWQDASPGTFADLGVLVWAPEGLVAGDQRAMLLADRQTLWIVDPATGSLSGLAIACPDCVVTQAVWLP